MSLSNPCVFGGASLPTNWSNALPGSGGSVTLNSDRITLGITSGTSKDSLFPGSASDQSQGVQGVQSDTDFDIAVEVGTDIHVQRGVGFGIFVMVGAQAYIRSSWYCQGGNNGGFSNLVRTEYSVYSTNGSTFTESSGTNANTGNLFNGGPSWFRLKRVGSAWTSYVSGDGVTWLTERTWTAAVTGVTAIKLGLMNTTTTTPAKAFGIFRVVDGSTFTLPAWTKTTHTNVRITDYTSAALPAWQSSTVSVGGSISFPGSPPRLRMTHHGATNRSSVTVANNVSPTTAQGLLCKFQIPGGTVTGQPFFDPGVMSNGLGAGVVDQYSLAGGNSYIIEFPGGTFDGSHVRAVRRTASPDAYTNYTMASTPSVGFESAYTHMLGDSITSSLNFAVAAWTRQESADGRYRAKFWLDGNAEPGAWMWDGLDRISANGSTGGVPSMNWAHNDDASVTVADDSVDVWYSETYDLVAPASYTQTAGTTLCDELNRLAQGGTTFDRTKWLEEDGAANIWAGTTGLALIGALNKKAGTTGIALNGVCNILASTTGLDPVTALRSIAS